MKTNKLLEGEVKCPHCKKAILAGFVRINGYCPTCTKRISKRDLVTLEAAATIERSRVERLNGRPVLRPNPEAAMSEGGHYLFDECGPTTCYTPPCSWRDWRDPSYKKRMCKMARQAA